MKYRTIKFDSIGELVQFLNSGETLDIVCILLEQHREFFRVPGYVLIYRV